MGFIKLPLELFDSPFWACERRYSEFEAILYLIRNQSFDDRPVTLDGKTVELRKGELIISYRSLAKVFGWSTGKVQAFLREQSTNTGIRTAKHTLGTVISLVDSPFYCDRMTSRRTPKQTPKNTHSKNNNITKCTSYDPNDLNISNIYIPAADASVSVSNPSESLPAKIRYPEDLPESKIYLFPHEHDSLVRRLGKECFYYLCDQVTRYYSNKNKGWFFKASHAEILETWHRRNIQGGKAFSTKAFDHTGKRLPEGYYPMWQLEKYNQGGAQQ